MTITQIKYFLTLVKNKNFTLTAAECFVSQPNLSKQITKMEEELETVLFYRNSKNVTLTEAGKLFFEYAEKIYSTYQSGIESLRHYKEITPIRVGYRAINLNMYDTLKKLSSKECYAGLQLMKGGMRAWEEGKFDMLFTWLTDFVDNHMLVVDERVPSLLIPKEKEINKYTDKVTFLEKETFFVLSGEMEGYVARKWKKQNFHPAIQAFESDDFDFQEYAASVLFHGYCGFQAVDDIGQFAEHFDVIDIPELRIRFNMGIIWKPEKDPVYRKLALDIQKNYGKRKDMK